MGGGESILVVEDEVDIRSMVGMALRIAGFRVAEAANGREALTRLREDTPLGLILLDLRMPIMNGWEFREEQLRDVALSTIPVVVMSGDGNVAAIAEAINAGDYLTKPIALGRLLATVRRHCAAPAR